jgi:hypothetical protein
MFIMRRQEDVPRVQQVVDSLCTMFSFVFAGDMLITFDRNMGFFEDARFMEAFNAGVSEDYEKTLIWRHHVYTWCARSCLRREGDFVECGVYRGFAVAVAAKYLDFARSGRQWYLYDTFSGVPADQRNANASDRSSDTSRYSQPGLYDACRQRFAAYPNVQVVQGRVPEVLGERAPQKVAFLHLDMNSAQAELAALEFFWPRLAPGAMVLLDDYGWRGYRDQKLAEDPFFAARERFVLELPTGQGLVLA